ncbi:LacI family DNA-binding transcriptional regulator [uncultured Vibrio sp.]|uniref:LacI family DNA-binding transcriptional regulator n=1 Tax=uncultured Vibrio sp. TaxID=114054 RepID=UPI0025DA866E|nr:LacI family DNA-binding transcriptional regulator [uncultured Vibrio sp.]
MTIRDLAKLSGVSIATVSRVLNNNERVSDDTRLAVEQAMVELNYQKPAPRRKKPTKLFGVIVRNMSNPFFAQLLDVIEEEAYKHGRSILLFNSRNNLQLEKTFLSECVNHKVDGVFLIPRSLKEAHLQPLKTLPFPVILLTATTPSIASIGTNHQHGGALVANHIVEQGHQHIGYLGASSRLSDRFIGFRDTLAENGRQLPDSHILTPFTTESLTDYIETNIHHAEHPLSAIFCSDDISAAQLHNALNQRPKGSRTQIDIVGFDDTFLAQSLGFSSVKQPIKQIALLGFDVMIHALQKGEIENREMLLEPSLVVRNTPVFSSFDRKAEILKEG